ALRALAAEAPVAHLSPALLASLGQALLAAGLDAVPLLREAQGRHPDDFWLNFLLANALAAGGRAEDAVGFYRAALALRPDATVVRVNLGTALDRARRPDEAFEAFRAAVAAAPRDARALGALAAAWQKRGRALREGGRPAEAVEAYRRASELLPGDAG